MDCVTYRRRLLEDPFRNDADVLQHGASCPRCAEFTRRTQNQEVMLRQAINSVKPPPELAERIRLAASIEETVRRPSRRWLALAASLVLLTTAISMGMLITPLERRYMGLADAVLHHVHDELRHMHEVNDVSPGQLAYLFGSYGATLQGELGPVNFAAECPMHKKGGLHLVLPGKFAPVTVFFLPGDQPERLVNVRDAQFQGHIVPTSWGSIAVLGVHREPLEGIAERLRDNITWPHHSQIGGRLTFTLPRA